MWPCDYVLTNRVQISLPWQLPAYSPGPLSPSIHPPSSCWNSTCWPGSDSEAHTLEGWHGELGRVRAPGKFVQTAARPDLDRTLVNSSHWTLMNLKHNYRGAVTFPASEYYPVSCCSGLSTKWPVSTLPDICFSPEFKVPQKQVSLPPK